MYHYVRKPQAGLEAMKALHVEDFQRQLDYFQANFGFIDKEEFFQSLERGVVQSEGVLLTFDDGLLDHYNYVFPELAARGLWGLFFVATSPYRTDKMLDVHRIHVLLAKVGGATLQEGLVRHVDEAMLSDIGIDEFRTRTYSTQENDAATVYTKRALNYYIDYRSRSLVLDRLEAEFLTSSDTDPNSYYATTDQLFEMHQHGMVIGSHTVNHPVMSKLSAEEQEKEIWNSFQDLEDFLGRLESKFFCYPYGWAHTYGKETLEFLRASGVSCAFAVEPRDVTSGDLERRFEIPRFDCNAFPFGACRC